MGAHLGVVREKERERETTTGAVGACGGPERLWDSQACHRRPHTYSSSLFVWLSGGSLVAHVPVNAPARPRAPVAHLQPRQAAKAADGEEEIPLTEEERVAADIFMLRAYRCNSPPVHPWASETDGDVVLLAQVFDPGRWRIDSKRERRSRNHKEITDSIDEFGAESKFVKARDPETGLNALHAAVINGFQVRRARRMSSPLLRPRGWRGKGRRVRAEGARRGSRHRDSV